MPRRPRWYRGDAVYCETQRTTDRAFFLKPDPVVRNIIGSAAGRALQMYPVKLTFNFPTSSVADLKNLNYSGALI